MRNLQKILAQKNYCRLLDFLVSHLKHECIMHQRFVKYNALNDCLMCRFTSRKKSSRYLNERAFKTSSKERLRLGIVTPVGKHNEFPRERAHRERVDLPRPLVRIGFLPSTQSFVVDAMAPSYGSSFNKNRIGPGYYYGVC